MLLNYAARSEERSDICFPGLFSGFAKDVTGSGGFDSEKHR